MATLDQGNTYAFISYASADRARVERVLDAVREAGVRVWIDHEGIAGGSSYGPAIATAIRESHAVIVFCSSASLASRNVRQEIAVAWKHDRPLLPLLLEPVEVLPDEVEYWLEGAQWIEVLSHPAERWLPPVIRALERAGMPVERRVSTEGAGTDPKRRFQVPTPLTALVGRRDDLAAVGDLITAHRLVTLLGPGGTGKTRLAISLASEQRQRFDTGVLFVNLAPIRDPHLVIPTIATTLEIRESGEQPVLDSLVSWIGEHRLLLVLDNCEQVVEAAPEISALLSRCSHLHVLATSRAPLHIAGEWEHLLMPLVVPEADDPPDLPSLRENESISLFIERAAAVRPDFDLTAENAAIISTICRRLDGLPLAIELAAARMKLLSASALLDRLGQPLALLVGGSRDLPAHQRTMRDTIQWSYELLEPEEQRLFQRLSIFVGGWTLEAAEVVGVAGGDLGIDVLDALASLADKSLLTQSVQPDGDTRFGMLETIHEFGHERLEASGERQDIEHRHALWVLEQVRAAEPMLLSPSRDVWLQQLDTELDNIRAAITRSLVGGDADTALSIAASLSWFWYLRGYFREGRRRLEQTLAASPQAPPTAARATALAGLARLAFYQESYQEAIAYANESVGQWRDLGGRHGLAHALVVRGLAHGNVTPAVAMESIHDARQLFTELGDPWGQAQASMYLGVSGVMGWMGDSADLAEARNYLEESARIYKRLGDQWQHGITLSYLAMIAERDGDILLARSLHEESLIQARGSGDQWRIRLTANRLGALLHRTGDFESAVALFEESLSVSSDLGVEEFRAYEQEQLGRVLLDWGKVADAVPYLAASLSTYRKLGEQDDVAVLLHSLGDASFARREYAAALDHYRESLGIAAAIDEHAMALHCIYGIARTLHRLHHLESAARLYAAVGKLREELEITLLTSYQAASDADLAGLRTQLGPEAFEVAWQSGVELSLDHAVACARSDADVPLA